MVCEKALWCVAYLCRYSEEYKSSVCLENAKGFGVCGVADLISSAIKKHNGNKNVLSAACDAIRSICSLESNRDRLGAAGTCETMARALIKYMNNPEVICWVCRAIGHLSNNNANNLEILGSNGACENIILALQKYPTSLQVCIECCYAIRNIALTTSNKGRLVRDFAPESILAVCKHHFASDVFAIEACHAIVNMISSESDELIYRVANGGYIGFGMKAIRKNPDNDVLVRWVYQGLYYLACDDRNINKLITSEVLDTLSVSLESHAGEENMAEWGCRFIEKILAQSSPHTIEITVNEEASKESKEADKKKDKDNVKVISKGSQALFLATCAKLRTAGMNEMITSAVQRQTISAVVASIGALCIGQMARDHNNQSRLSSAGACEGVVTALKRHSSHADVCTNTCYSIYYLCKEINNISWMGAYGACEAVCNALKIYSNDPNVVRYASLAVAALAYKDEGNLERLQKSDVNNILVAACSIHISTNYFIAENMCHAISNLCLEGSNVNNLGKCGACGLVVDILYSYASMHSVVTQALLAIAALAVKQKTNKVHKGNTRKLVEKGVLEVSIAVIQKFIEFDDVQRAGGLALTALARLEVNKLQLSKNNACELIMHSMQLHIGNPLVLVKLIFAIEALTSHCDANIQKFTALHVIEVLLQVLAKHESVHYIVECVLTTLINICMINKNNFISVFSEAACKLYMKTLKLHFKHPKVAKWGCHLIYTATVPPFMRSFGVSTNGGSEKLLGSGKDHHADSSKKGTDEPPKVEAIPPACVAQARKLFGHETKASETLVGILNKYLRTEEGEEKRKDSSKDQNQMNNMHALHQYQTNTSSEVLIYASMAIYALSLFEPNKRKLLDHDISSALLKVLLEHYKDSILCEWILINVNNLLLTNNPSEKVRLGQQHIMKGVFNIVNLYSVNSGHGHENNMSIIKLVCDSIYELCLVPTNQQQLAAIKEGTKEATTTIVDLMISLIGTYKDNLDLITVIFKAMSSICINNNKATTKNTSSITSTLFGSSPAHGATNSTNLEHVVANAFLDAGLADLLLKAIDRHSDSAMLVQWCCATVVSLCTKNSRAQILLAGHFHLIAKLTPLLVNHKNAIPCVTQITRCFRSLVVNAPDHNSFIAKSPIIMPTLLELLQLHVNNDGLVDHVCFLLGNIEYKPSSAHWSAIAGNVRRAKDDFQTPVKAIKAEEKVASPVPTPGGTAAVTSKAFYGSMANYDLLYSVLQTHLDKNTNLNRKVAASANGPPVRACNNNNVIRMICMAITLFAEKGKLHHHNLCTLLVNLLSKETVLNNNDDMLIQKILVLVGTLCKSNEQNNTLLCVSNSLVEEIDLYIHEYKESNVVLYGVMFALIGICEFNLVENQAKINASASITSSLVTIIFNDLETDFISQYGCMIVSCITKNNNKNQLKCHGVCNYIADVILTHKTNPVIVLECLKAISTLAHGCITNRNRLGTSDVCQTVCSVFAGSIMEEELTNTTHFMKFPNNVYHWGAKCIGDLAANHANNCTKLGAAGASEILLAMLKRPQQNAGMIHSSVLPPCV